MAAARHAVGVDVGGTHLRAAVVAEDGKVVQVVRHHLAEREPEALLALMQAAVAQLGPEAASLPMGVGLAAQIWLPRGTVAVAPNLGWREVPFGPMLDRAFNRPVRMLNDLDAIVLGEAVCGAAAGIKHVLCVFVGTGVGMSAVVNGEILEGADGLATELGHIKVASVVDGRACGCGERGCLEAYCSGRHLPSLLQAKAAQGLACPLLEAVAAGTDQIDAGRIDAAALRGDAAAVALWDDISTMLARCIGDTITIFNPRVLVLGGGVLLSAAHLKRQTLDRIPHFAARPAQQHLVVRNTSLGDDAGAIGAALAALAGPTVAGG